MQVEARRLQEFLGTARLQSDGDPVERRFGQAVLQSFPNYERFWQRFVVPATRRMEGYPLELTGDVHYRDSIAAQVQDIVEAHYSAFVHLVYAHLHLGQSETSWLEDTSVHLGAACDLAEAFLEQSYLLLLNCRGGQSKVLETLTRDEFLQLAGAWYHDRYHEFHTFYLARGKSPPLKLPAREHLLKEFVQELLERPDLWTRYSRHSQLVRQFRNVMVHNSLVGRIVERNGQFLVPSPQVIHQYRTWRDVFAAAQDAELIKSHFVEPHQQLEGDLRKLETILNELWQPLIEQFDTEFYSETATLQKMHDIEFRREPQASPPAVTSRVLVECPNCGYRGEIPRARMKAEVSEHQESLSRGHSTYAVGLPLIPLKCPKCGVAPLQITDLAQHPDEADGEARER